MLSRLLSIFSIFITISIAGLLVVIFSVNHWASRPLAITSEQQINIQPGDTLGKISYQLAENKQLSTPKLFLLYAKLTQRTKIKVGEYQIPAGVTPEQ